MKFGFKFIGVVFVTIISFIGVFSYVFDSKIDLNGDNANYYVLGKSIHQGEGYVNINSVFKSPNNHFPPGYPAIISVIFIFSESIIAVKIANGLFLLASIILSFIIIREITNRDLVAWLSLPFLILNVHLLKYGTMMMTEISFLFFSLLSFLYFLRADSAEGKKMMFSYILAFLFFIVAFYIRTLGIAILAAYSLVLLFRWREKWKVMIAFIAGFVVCYFPWWLRAKNLGGSSYLKQLVMINPYRPELGEVGLGNLITRIGSNAGRYLSREIPEVLFPFKTFSYKESAGVGEWITGIIIASIIVLGIVHLKKYRKLIVGYMAATFAVLLIWPDVWVGIRFVLPTLPFLLLFFLLGIEYAIEMIKKSLRWKNKLLLMVVLLLLFPFYGEINNMHHNANNDYVGKWKNYFSLGKSLKRSGMSDVVVSCRKPSLFYLYSGTFTTRYKYTLDDQELLKDLEKRKVDFVVVEQLGYSSTYRYLVPAIKKNQDRFNLVSVIENPETYLLEFKHAPYK